MRQALFAGLLLSLPTIPVIASAQTLPAGCPGIYYLEPFNETRIVPQGCPPNAATLRQNGGQTLTTPTVQPGVPNNTPAPIPLPETVQEPSAFVSLNNGAVDVRIINTMNTTVQYQALGDTNQRELTPVSEVLLQSLRTPVNITFVRPDGGFVVVTPNAEGAGLLEVTLTEAPTVDASSGSLFIQENGGVYLN